METTDDATGPTAQAATATTTEWSPELATVLTGAVELARTAIIEHSGDDTVGDYLGAGYEDPTSATHRFLAHLPGYQGWQWAVVVASYPGADHATISEVVLVPGPESWLAPQWVPWDQRVRPGDLSPGDLLAPPADDLRLVPGYMSSGDPQVDETAAEIGLGRRTVMSAWGRGGPALTRRHDQRARTAAEMGPARGAVMRAWGRGGPALARRRPRPPRADGTVHQACLPRLRVPPAARRFARGDVRGLRARDVGRRIHRRFRIRLRRALRHPRARG